MAALTYDLAYNKMLNGLSPVDVWEDWKKSALAPTPVEESNSRQAIAFAWEAARKVSIKSRIGRKA